jgi:transcriptional regulator with XRE-family HTH domain
MDMQDTLRSPQAPARVSKKELGARIRGRRKYLDLTQKELGYRLGVDGSRISKIESGEQGMKIEFFGQLCEELGVTDAELLYERSPHAGVVQW